MGTHDFFKEKRKRRAERKIGFKKPHPNSFLIVTEGKCTEPNYFGGIKALITEKGGGNIDIEYVPTVDISGIGRSTMSLIKKVDEIVNKSKLIYQNIWIVFDKDDFKDFDRAIFVAEEKGYKTAWSNQCFEYWLYLHFEYSDSALHRDEWKRKLTNLFGQYNLNNGKYHKNIPEIYDQLSSINGVKKAIKFSKKRMAGYKPKKLKPSEYDPGTTVYELVEALLSYLDE